MRNLRKLNRDQAHRFFEILNEVFGGMKMVLKQTERCKGGKQVNWIKLYSAPGAL